MGAARGHFAASNLQPEVSAKSSTGAHAVLPHSSWLLSALRTPLLVAIRTSLNQSPEQNEPAGFKQKVKIMACAEASVPACLCFSSSSLQGCWMQQGKEKCCYMGASLPLHCDAAEPRTLRGPSTCGTAAPSILPTLPPLQQGYS